MPRNFEELSPARQRMNIVMGYILFAFFFSGLIAHVLSPSKPETATQTPADKAACLSRAIDRTNEKVGSVLHSESDINQAVAIYNRECGSP
jgi:hypothetical protein